MKNHKPGELFNKFQKKKHKIMAIKSVKPMSQKAQMQSHLTHLYDNPKASFGAGFGGEKPGSIKGAKSKKKNWIAGAIKHPGALHRQLGIKSGHKIPAKTLKNASKKGGKIGARARLAETLKSFHHKKHKKNKSEFAPSKLPTKGTTSYKTMCKKHKIKHCSKCG